MSKNDYVQETTNYADSKHRNISAEDDLLVHLTQPCSSRQGVVDDDRAQYNDEKRFTDLRSCTEPIDTDSDSSRTSSSVTVDNKQSKSIFYSSCLQSIHSRPNEDDDIHHQPTAISCPLEAYHLKSFYDILHLIEKYPYQFIYAAIPKNHNNYMQCRIVRDKSGLFQTFHLEVELEKNEKAVCLLTAEKQTKMIGQSQYTITPDSHFSENSYSAELVCNSASGTSYTLNVLNNDQRQELAHVLYEPNFLGLKGPRKFEVLLPIFDRHMQVLLKEDEINEYYSDEQNDSFIRLHNKMPTWNSDSYSYVLKFDGKNRASLASIKNFQMVIRNRKDIEEIVMQFGRMSENVFSCDFLYPLSFIQAFGIGLTVFETGLFRE